MVVTVMATAPGRGSSEGASPTASVTALLRVPGGAEVSGFGIRERLIALTVHARRQGPGMNTGTRDAALAFTGTGTVHLYCTGIQYRRPRENAPPRCRHRSNSARHHRVRDFLPETIDSRAPCNQPIETVLPAGSLRCSSRGGVCCPAPGERCDPNLACTHGRGAADCSGAFRTSSLS